MIWYVAALVASVLGARGLSVQGERGRGGCVCARRGLHREVAPGLAGWLHRGLMRGFAPRFRTSGRGEDGARPRGAVRAALLRLRLGFASPPVSVRGRGQRAGLRGGLHCFIFY